MKELQTVVRRVARKVERTADWLAVALDPPLVGMLVRMTAEMRAGRKVERTVAVTVHPSAEPMVAKTERHLVDWKVGPWEHQKVEMMVAYWAGLTVVLTAVRRVAVKVERKVATLVSLMAALKVG